MYCRCYRLVLVFQWTTAILLSTLLTFTLATDLHSELLAACNKRCVRVYQQCKASADKTRDRWRQQCQRDHQRCLFQCRVKYARNSPSPSCSRALQMNEGGSLRWRTRLYIYIVTCKDAQSMFSVWLRRGSSTREYGISNSMTAIAT